jgi:hypothetical protein
MVGRAEGRDLIVTDDEELAFLLGSIPPKVFIGARWSSRLSAKLLPTITATATFTVRDPAPAERLKSALSEFKATVRSTSGPDGIRLSGHVGSENFNMNPTLFVIAIRGTSLTGVASVHIRTAAKEGLIKQRSAQKASIAFVRPFRTSSSSDIRFVGTAEHASQRQLSALAEGLDPAALTGWEVAYKTEGSQVGRLSSMCGIEECEVLHLPGRGIKRCEHLVATGNGDTGGMIEHAPVKLAVHEHNDDGLVGVNCVARRDELDGRATSRQHCNPRARAHSPGDRGRASYPTGRARQLLTGQRDPDGRGSRTKRREG